MEVGRPRRDHRRAGVSSSPTALEGAVLRRGGQTGAGPELGLRGHGFSAEWVRPPSAGARGGARRCRARPSWAGPEARTRAAAGPLAGPGLWTPRQQGRWPQTGNLQGEGSAGTQAEVSLQLGGPQPCWDSPGDGELTTMQAGQAPPHKAPTVPPPARPVPTPWFLTAPASHKGSPRAWGVGGGSSPHVPAREHPGLAADPQVMRWPGRGSRD